MDISVVLDYLQNIPFTEVNQLKYKVINSADADNLGISKNSCAKILSKDPLIKNDKVNPGDVVAIYRDYQLKVSPYYYYRVVV